MNNSSNYIHAWKFSARLFNDYYYYFALLFICWVSITFVFDVRCLLFTVHSVYCVHTKNHLIGYKIVQLHSSFARKYKTQNEKFWNCHKWPLDDLRLENLDKRERMREFHLFKMSYQMDIVWSLNDINVLDRYEGFCGCVSHLNEWIRWINVFAVLQRHCCLFVCKYLLSDFWENLLSWIASFILNIEYVCNIM